MLDPWALSYKARKKHFYYNLFEKPTLEQASAIQVLASSEAEQVKSLGFQNSIVVPNGIHQEQFETLPEPELFYQKFPGTWNKSLILFLGRIDPKKGLDLLAPAFAKTHNKFPQTHLIVAVPDSIYFLPTVKDYFKQAVFFDSFTFSGLIIGSLKYDSLVTIPSF